MTFIYWIGIALTIGVMLNLFMSSGLTWKDVTAHYAGILLGCALVAFSKGIIHL